MKKGPMSLEDRIKALPNLKWPKDEAFVLLDDFIGTLLADLTNQTALVHSTYVYKNEYKHPTCVELSRERPSGLGFWNAVGKFMGINQTVLDVRFNGQMWCCRYYVPFYYMLAEQVRDFYYDKLKDVFGKDFVIVKS